MPWQLLLLFELLGGLLKAQHCLIDEVAGNCIQLGACLPTSTGNQLLQASILQLYQLLALQTLVAPSIISGSGRPLLQRICSCLSDAWQNHTEYPFLA